MKTLNFRSYVVSPFIWISFVLLAGCGDSSASRGTAVGPSAAEIDEFVQLWEQAHQKAASQKQPLNPQEVKRIEHLAYLLVPDLSTDTRLDSLRWAVQFAVASKQSVGFAIALCPISEFEEGKPLTAVNARILISAQYDPNRTPPVSPLPTWTPGIKLTSAWLTAGDVLVLPHRGGDSDFAHALVWSIRFDVMAKVGAKPSGSTGS